MTLAFYLSGAPAIAIILLILVLLVVGAVVLIRAAGKGAKSVARKASGDDHGSRR